MLIRRTYCKTAEQNKIYVENLYDIEERWNTFPIRYQINLSVPYYLMTKNYLFEIGQVKPPPPPEAPEEGEDKGTGNHNEDNKDPA